MPSLTTLNVLRLRLRIEAEAASLPALAAVIIIIIIILVAWLGARRLTSSALLTLRKRGTK